MGPESEHEEGRAAPAAIPSAPSPPTEPEPPTGDPDARPGRTRISAVWTGLIVGAVLFVLLLVFILQNTKSVRISYFTASGDVPVGVVVLLAAIAGVLLAGAAGSLRMYQLRRRRSRGTPKPEHRHPPT